MKNVYDKTDKGLKFFGICIVVGAVIGILALCGVTSGGIVESLLGIIETV